jgi:hypothetical protein
MASNNYIYKMSNAGGMSTVTRYTDMLAGNTTWNPFIPAGAYESIATATLSSSAATVTFSSIPSTYKHLQIRVLARSVSGADWISTNFNGDNAGTNYSRHLLQGNGSTVSASWGNDTLAVLIYDTANGFAGGVIDILDYADTNKFKTVRTLSGQDNNGTGAVQLNSFNWRNTAAIDTIRLSSTNMAANSSFALYGIRGN